MSAPTIVYLHGFNSSPLSAKGQQIARAAALLSDPPRFHLPQLATEPAQALREVCGWIDANASGERDLALIGSSLGGYYATWLAERYGARAIVINPAVRPSHDLRAYLGCQRNPYTGEEYEVTLAHLEQLAAFRVTRITRPERYFLLARTGDEVLDWRVAAPYYAGAFQYVAGGGDHGWVDFGGEIPSVLRFAGCRA